MDAHQFVPIPYLANAHLMTVAAALWPRRFTRTVSSGEKRLFEVEPGSRIMAICHWQGDRHRQPTVLILHGMEGSSSSHNVLGLTEKALACGMNVVRMNLRNCGDTTELTPTLYNAGMSADVVAVLTELRNKDGLDNIIIVGWSLGGNIVLKAAAELGDKAARLISCVCAVSPAIDLALCVQKLQEGFNRFYEQRFLRGLKTRLRSKSKLYPRIYDPAPLASITSIRQFDETYTAPLGGFGTADNYYRTASALPLLDKIRIPALIVQAQDDPLVPFCSFQSDQLNNPHITLIAPQQGGHGGFLQRQPEDHLVFDRFWAENRVVTFCINNKLSGAMP